MAASLPLYRDLCALRQEVRLLKLQPSHDSSSPISAFLSVDSLADNPYYVALSYAWGLPSNPEPTISLSGHKKTVTKNLSTALYALRDNKETRTLWIDALCINQGDNVEKSYQIELMGEIYRKCASCWIWLGEAKTSETSAAVALLKYWANDQHHLRSNVYFDSTCIETATELTKRDWFKRVWTVQEAILPTNLVIICGSHTISWTVFADAAKSVHKHLTSPCCSKHNDTNNAYMKDVSDFLDAIGTIERSRKPLHTKRSRKSDDSKLEILTCLYYYRHRQAKHAQDKIFGLRSLVDSDGQKLIKLDCTASVEDVYTSLCIEHIKQTGSLEALKYVLWPAEQSELETTLPSWVPDWRLDIPEPTWQKRRVDRYSLYEACGDHSSLPEPFSSVSGRYVLKDRGLRCGVVAKVGSQRPAQWSDTSKEMKEVSSRKKRGKKTWWSKGRKQDEEKGQCIPKDWADIAKLDRREAKLAFWRTLIMDTIGETVGSKVTSFQRASETDYKEYEDLLMRVMKGTGWPADTDRIYIALETATLLRRFFITEDSHFGIGPARMEEEDIIYVMRGGRCPLVLRLSGQTGTYRLIGDCFLDGFM